MPDQRADVPGSGQRTLPGKDLPAADRATEEDYQWKRTTPKKVTQPGEYPFGRVLLSIQNPELFDAVSG
jgi:hypothetical protein